THRQAGGPLRPSDFPDRMVRPPGHMEIPPQQIEPGDDAAEAQEVAIESRPDCVPFALPMEGLKVEHVETVSGWETVFGRRCVRPDLCKLCPAGKGCRNGGFAFVRVKGRLSAESCA